VRKNILYSWTFNVIYHVVHALSFLFFFSDIGLYGEVLGFTIYFLIIKSIVGMLLYKVLGFLVQHIIHKHTIVSFVVFFVAYTLSYFFVIAYTTFFSITEASYLFWRLLTLNPPEDSQLFFYSVYKALGCSWLLIALLTIIVSRIQKKLNKPNKPQVSS